MSNRYANTPVYTDDMVPQGWAGSYHVGEGVFRQKCRACSLTHDSANGSVPRYRGIGPHEYNVHGLDVAGINVGMLP